MNLSDLTPDPKNARKHNPRNLKAISRSLAEVGAARSIVVDEDGRILAGNGTVEAARKAGLTKLQVVDADGETVIAVRRRGLTEAQKTSLALADNRANELSEWDVDVLKALRSDGVDLSALWTEPELTGLLGLELKAGLTDPDAVPEMLATSIQRGDLFQLGQHRLLCGDARADLSRLLPEPPSLLLTDPPYGLNIVSVKGGTLGGRGIAHPRKYRPIIGDDEPFNPIPLLTVGRRQVIFGANYFASCLPDGNAWIAWDKNVHGNFSEVELAWTSLKGRLRLYRHTWSGLVRSGPRNEELTERVHPTQKPVGLLAAIMGDFSGQFETVCDPYLGSGSTVIAAERVGRYCYGCEIDPRYCQIIIDRWEAFTGQKSVKLGSVDAAR